VELGLKGRTGIVTGASAGLGRAIATSLAAEGVQLAIVARRRDALELLAAELEASGAPRPITIEQDLAAPDAAARVAEQALDSLGRVEILINNAGGHRPAGTFGSDEQWDAAFAINFVIHRRLTALILPSMTTNNWGRIVNVTGRSEPLAVGGGSAAKAAMHSWAKGLSREVGPMGVTVNSIAPGKITSEQMLRDYSADERAAHIAEIPAGRYGEPEDIAALATFLASERAGYITGTITRVDGGLTRHI
jgi:3-oxoacyl-[acyl-carrier protein] reductase